jgi:hypothetical protein
MGQGASRRTEVGRVRSPDFLSILRGCSLLAQDMQALKFFCIEIVFPQPVIELNGTTHRRKTLRIALFTLVNARTHVKIDHLQTLC